MRAAQITEASPRVEYSDNHKLPDAIKATGNDIKDVKACGTILTTHIYVLSTARLVQNESNSRVLDESGKDH
jgi:hypothetical protein